MQAGSNPHLDANAVNSPEIRSDDPRHLGNLTKKMASMNAQVSADTKYDTTPPPRVDSSGKIVNEQFVSPIEDSDDAIFIQMMYLLVGLCLIIIVFGLLVLADPRLRRLVLSNNYGLITVVMAIVVSIFTIGLIKYNLDKNEEQKWYPIQQYTS